MRDSQRADTLGELAELVGVLDQRAEPAKARPGPKRLLPAATRAAHRLDDFAGRGYPARSPQGGTGAQVTRPVEDLVVAGRPDAYAATRQRLDVLLTQARGALAEAVRITLGTLVSTSTGDESISLDEDDWCASCQRVIREGDPVLSPTFATPSQEDLPHRPLCRWCYDFAGVYRFWPPTELVKKHAEGKRVYDKDIDAAVKRARPTVGGSIPAT